jgi:hypothetical protein
VHTAVVPPPPEVLAAHAPFLLSSCARCGQRLIAPGPPDPGQRHRDESEGRSIDFAKPFSYQRSLVHVPGCWRRLPTIVPITDQVLSDIRATFIPRDSDIWLATYPKCGTTWVQSVLSFLILDDPPPTPAPTPAPAPASAPASAPALGDGSGSGGLQPRPVQVGLRMDDDTLWLEALCGIHGVEEVNHITLH